MRHLTLRAHLRPWTQVGAFTLAAVVVLTTALRTTTPTPAAAQDVRAAADERDSPVADVVDVPATPSPSEVADGRITLAFGGDVHGEEQIARALATGLEVLADAAGPLADADVAMVNLETPVGNGGTRAAKTYTFQAPPALLDDLSGAGVDVVGIANNHALDRGIDGLADTVTNASASGLAVVGGGPDAEAAYAPLVVERNGVRVAILALSRVLPHRGWTAGPRSPGLASGYDVPRAVDAVRAARDIADHVVVFTHWGTERAACPDTTQVELARALHEAGARVVVGAHPHVFQGIARPRPDQLTAYSLGNLVWYATAQTSGLTGVLTVTLDRTGVVDVSVVPLRIGADGRPHAASEADAARLDEVISTRVPGTGCPAAGIPHAS